MKFFKKIPLKFRLSLLVFVPLIGLLYFSYRNIKEDNARISHVLVLNEKIKLTEYISEAAKELQNERTASLNYSLKKGAYKEELGSQRIKTSLALKELSKQILAFDPTYEKNTLLNHLEHQRQQISEFKMQPVEIRMYFKQVIFNLLYYLPHEESLHYTEVVQPELRTGLHLERASIYHSLIRSEIYSILKEKEISGDAYGTLKNLEMNYQSDISSFLANGTPAAIHDYQTEFRGDDVSFTLGVIEQFRRIPNLLPHVDAEKWMQSSGHTLNLLNTIKGRNLAILKNKGEKLHAQALQDRRIVVVIVLCLIAIALLLSYAVIQSISSSLNQIGEAIVLFAQGKIIHRLKVESNDVIGVVAESINQVDESNEQIIKAANAIGNEDFSHQVPIRSQEDMLGAALVRMKEKLQVLSEAAKLKDWVVTGMTKLNDELKGEKDPSTLAKNIIEYLAEYSNSQVGAMYLLEDNNELKLYGSYALTANESKQRVKLGEGLVGQAALEKRVLLLDNIPEDYLKISFAAGELKPKNILIIPILFDNALSGVIELGSVEGFTSRELELLNLISLNIAIAVIASQNRKKVQELLDETQTQSVALQSQQDLLEKLNSELEERNSIIQGSEEALKNTNEELEGKGQELEEKNRALNEKNEAVLQASRELEEKSELLERTSQYKSEFLANMSHELRTPLNSILLLSQLLGDNDNKNLDEEQVEYAKVVHNSGKNLLELIDDILDLSKIESGKMLVEPESVPFPDIKYDIESTFQQIAKKKNVDFELRLGADLPTHIYTDKLRLEQVLKNLLSNAFKFTSEGKVMLEIMPAPAGNGEVNMVYFKVSDTGIGIPAEKQQLIFEAFQQVDGSTRRKYGGTGLGLSISREIADVLGGEIRVESEINKGSSFTFFVPLMYTAKKEKTEIRPVSVIASTPEPIPHAKTLFTVESIPEEIPDDRDNINAGDQVYMIVEDDTSLARLFLKYFQRKNCKAIVIVQGDKVLEYAVKFAPAGILLDIRLPVIDGWQVLELLKANAATRHIPVHVNSVLNVRMQSLMKGADEFSQKPLSTTEIDSIIDKMLIAGKNRKVLIVESNKPHADSLSQYLRASSVEVFVSTETERAFEILEKENPSCLVLDVSENRSEDYHILEILLNLPAYENLKIVVFTGKNTTPENLKKIRAFNEFLVIKTASTYKQVLQEAGLFLHLPESKSSEEQEIITSLVWNSLEGKTILITDDDVRNIFALTKVLEQHKINVITATDGKETIKSLKVNTQIDLILMDMMMPEMDGYEAMQKIREMKSYSNLPIIAVTAKAMQGDREKCIAAGASDYITKPVDIEQLITVLRAWMN
jgi:signal transduction histidine kinase/CheY-like chemotaxis protein/HAMP domain-containing protein